MTDECRRAVRIVLHPAEGKPGRYRALWDGKHLVTSREPLYSSARVLLAEGLDPETVLEAQHAGSPIVAMRSTIGEAARWTVSETDKGGLRKRLWQPFPNPTQQGPERNQRLAPTHDRSNRYRGGPASGAG